MYATKFFLLLLYVQFSFGDVTSTFENTKQKEEDVTVTDIDDQKHDINDAEEDELLRDLDDVTSMFENTKQKEKDVTVTETAATSSVDSSYNNPASRVYSSDPKTNISRPTTKTTSNIAGVSSRFPVPPECMNYKLLNEANRAEGYSSKFRRTLCDKILPKDWYRFTGDAGNKMPDFCVAKLRCGAHAPGWLNRSHPSVVDGIIDAKVCFHWGSNCCSWSTDVRVRNCGKFFVYQLQPVPLCSLRYCGNNRQVPVLTTPNAVTPTNDPSSPSLAKECKVYKTLNERDRSQSYLYNSDQGARPTCDRWLTRDWYRFTGLAGNRMPDICVPVQRCGTLAPGWLQGGHPNVDAGVVSRMVCFSWGRDCCTWRSRISVRNCGDFYVYKLTNAPVCKLRYCGNGNSEGTTTTTPTTTPAYPAEPTSGFGIVCLSAEMHVHIGRRSLPRLVNPSLLRLDDARCGVTRVTDDEIMLATPLDSCGTMRRTREDGTVSFQNKVVAEFGEGNKRSFAEFPFRCTYRKVTSLKEMVHLQPLFKEGLAMDSTMNEEDQTLNRFISE